MIGERTGTSSPFVGAIEPITATDEELRAFLADAALLPLIPSLAYLTGDLTLLRDELRPDPLMLRMPQGGLSEQQQETIRALALEVLAGYRDRGCPPPPATADEDLLRMMEFAVGGSDM